MTNEREKKPPRYPAAQDLIELVMKVRASEFHADPGSYEEGSLIPRIDRWRENVDWLRSDNPYVVAFAAHVYGRAESHPYLRQPTVLKVAAQLHEQLPVPPFQGRFRPWVERACDRSTDDDERRQIIAALKVIAPVYSTDFTGEEDLLDTLDTAAADAEDPLVVELTRLKAAVNGVED